MLVIGLLCSEDIRGMMYIHGKKSIFGGYDIDSKNKIKVKILDFLQNWFRMFSYEDDELLSFIEKLKRAKYLEGYSSAIYETARMINNKKLIEINLKI